MTGTVGENSDRALRQLEKNGLLLVSGSEIPDLCSLVSGAKVKGSWWSSPFAHEIFAISELLSEHADVTLTKLISGKVTFVHRSLWPNLVAVGIARDEWQMQQLSRAGVQLLEELDKQGTLATNSLGRSFGPKPGNIARELELKLLIHADQIHTETGQHAKVLETWSTWAKRVGLKMPTVRPKAARQFFDKRIREINEEFKGCGRLPWS
jgi:hypothetical protein